jgi:hypothetical protein
MGRMAGIDHGNNRNVASLREALAHDTGFALESKKDGEGIYNERFRS